MLQGCCGNVDERGFAGLTPTKVAAKHATTCTEVTLLATLRTRWNQVPGRGVDNDTRLVGEGVDNEPDNETVHTRGS